MYPQYMCIMLYVILIWCTMVFQRYIVNWSRLEGYMYPQYMCILLICVHFFAVTWYFRDVL